MFTPDLAMRSTATSTNGLALYFSSLGSGMYRISRVVLSGLSGFPNDI